MSTDEFIVNLNKTLTNPKVLADAFSTAVYDLAAGMGTRIFQEGKNSNDSKIGQYDTMLPLYINPNKAPRKGSIKTAGGGKLQGLTPTVGKTGEHKFKNGKVHKTTFLHNYKELRNRTGRRIDFVNLDLTNDLRFDFSSQKAGGEHNPVKINDFEFQLTVERSKDKIDGNEKRFNARIFQPSKKDESHFLETLNVEIQRRLNAQ